MGFDQHKVPGQSPTAIECERRDGGNGGEQGVAIIAIWRRFVFHASSHCDDLLLSDSPVVFYHARGLKRTPLLVHMVPLLFSALFYFAAFVVQGSTEHGNNLHSPAADIIKLVLWYFPILVEIISYFVSLSLQGWMEHSIESVYTRSATVFLIILGINFDQISSSVFLISNPRVGSGQDH